MFWKPGPSSSTETLVRPLRAFGSMVTVQTVHSGASSQAFWMSSFRSSHGSRPAWSSRIPSWDTAKRSVVLGMVWVLRAWSLGFIMRLRARVRGAGQGEAPLARARASCWCERAQRAMARASAASVVRVPGMPRVAWTVMRICSLVAAP